MTSQANARSFGDLVATSGIRCPNAPSGQWEENSVHVQLASGNTSQTPGLRLVPSNPDLLRLAELVDIAGQRWPTTTAVGSGDAILLFSELRSRAMAARKLLGNLKACSPAALEDSAIAMALMTSVPGLADSGPDGFAAALSTVRRNAAKALTDHKLPGGNAETLELSPLDGGPRRRHRRTSLRVRTADV